MEVIFGLIIGLTLVGLSVWQIRSRSHSTAEESDATLTRYVELLKEFSAQSEEERELLENHHNKND
ncbi:hypothetical protein [Myxosarcina sp. GI1]|uniref:hypothetical protein n=1 Tax=Myxosarcina sp. GI1 TaxID=1541065 RepID=UPI000564F48B|nr:hypothetical protein [Myxosarcina sp. GI1]